MNGDSKEQGTLCIIYLYICISYIYGWGNKDIQNLPYKYLSFMLLEDMIIPT
jgi:hypothetical protein